MPTTVNTSNYYIASIYKDKIPENTPQEVKQVLSRKALCKRHASDLSSVGTKMLQERVKMAQDIKALGYNPLDYNLDLEKLNQTLSDIRAGKAYEKALLDFHNNKIAQKGYNILKKIGNLFKKCHI